MRVTLAYICTECGEIEERCAQGKCPHCLSDEVFPLSGLLKSAGVEIASTMTVGDLK